MEFKKALDKLVKGPVFSDWYNDNKEFFLANLFVDESELQFGYCRKEDSKIVSFIVKEDNIEKFEDEVFKRPEAKTIKLNIECVDVGIDRAMGLVEAEKEKSYAIEDVTKKIIILHNSDKGPIWNITLITKSFNMINIKIDAKKGNILSSGKRSLLQLGKESK
ncbi:MAG: hypothetical protein KAQ83_02860 [Nanoarchaeota archaeon]|nr:hypothetical protein [Nanoarchaeota archaeon]